MSYTCIQKESASITRWKTTFLYIAMEHRKIHVLDSYSAAYQTVTTNGFRLRYVANQNTGTAIGSQISSSMSTGFLIIKNVQFLCFDWLLNESRQIVAEHYSKVDITYSKTLSNADSTACSTVK